MTQTVVAFRSEDAGVLAGYEAWEAEAREQQERIADFTTRYDLDGSLTLRAWSWPGWRFAYFEGEKLPQGWRETDGRILPDKRLKAGKAAAADIDALNAGAPKSLISHVEGMPHRAMRGSHVGSPGAFRHNGAVYVHWSVMPEGVDGAIWDELKLSEFYAAQESYEADEAEVPA